MRQNPFRSKAREIHSRGYTYGQMAKMSGGVRKASWWNNLVLYGPWKGPRDARVAPPTPETIPAIAAFFGLTPEEVAAMIAADWYGVYPPPEVHPQVQQMQAAIATLSAKDARRVEDLARRLAFGEAEEAEAA